MTLRHQIAEVRREIAMRERVYPGLVARRKMAREDAETHTARMEAVLATLLRLEAQREPDLFATDSPDPQSAGV